VSEREIERGRDKDRENVTIKQIKKGRGREIVTKRNKENDRVSQRARHREGKSECVHKCAYMCIKQIEKESM